jgi:glutamate 5-kinase
MALYQDAFGRLGLVAAQVLLVEDDFSSRQRYLNLRATLNRLLELKAVPILNENDVVSTVELEDPEGSSRVFGDNDKLSALVASKMEADLLVLLSDVDGLHTGNPSQKKDTRRLSVVERLTSEIRAYAEGGGSRGRGGMKTKLAAAEIATRSGAITIIANGRQPEILDRVMEGEDVGTVFLPLRILDGKRRWIAYAATVAGSATVNDGARQAIVERKASLLPAGITDLSGEWERGDVVEIRDRSGHLFARGMVNYGSAEAQKVLGMRSDEVQALLKKKSLDALVTRNYIVILDPEEAV